MDTQKSMPVHQASNDEIIQNIETCCLCGSRLYFTHKTDYLNLQVTEESACTECGIKSKTIHHILQ